MAIDLNVPQPVQEGLKSLAHFSVADRDSLLSILSKQKPVLNPSELTDALSSAIANVSRDEVDAVLVPLISLSSALRVYSSTPPEIARTALDSIQSEIPQESRSELEDTLTQLLKVESVVVTAKALEVQQSHSSVYRRAQILSDVRPLFSEDSHGVPAAGLVIHTLQIIHSHNDMREQFFVVMDDRDLNQLKSLIDRALDKAESLKKMLSASNTLCLEVKQDA